MLLGAALVPSEAGSRSVEPIPKALRIDHRMNVVQFNRGNTLSGLPGLFKRAGKDGLRILHVGDSHVQYGISTAALREQLQRQYGNGGMGLVFPYAIPDTYSPPGYTSEMTGEWECGLTRSIPPAIPVGMMGMACRTSDALASFTIRFNKTQPERQKRLRILVPRYDSVYTFELIADGEVSTIEVKPRASTPQAADEWTITVDLDKAPRELSFRPLDGLTPETPFVVHGISLENTKPGGVIVDAAGVGASRFRGILHSDLFEVQVSSFRPDIVIIDFGTNDVFKKDEMPTDLEDTIREVVGRVRRSVPDAVIVLTSANDLYWKKKPTPLTLQFAVLVGRIAHEEHVAFWDWYWVAGGPMAMARWMKNDMTQTDGVHMNSKGYRIKGRLLADAFDSTLRWMKAHPRWRSYTVKAPNRGYPKRRR